MMVTLRGDSIDPELYSRNTIPYRSTIRCT
jgi:hypothetical protein